MTETKEKYGYIYKITDLFKTHSENENVNLLYIGQRIGNELDRTYSGSGKYLKNSYFKHCGTRNPKISEDDYIYDLNNEKHYKVEIIDFAENKEDLNAKEIFWIATYNTFNDPEHYNLTKGGDGGDTISGLSEEEKAAIAEKNRQAQNRPEVKEKKRQAQIERYANMSEEEKAAIAEKQRQAQIERYANMSEEEKAAIAEKKRQAQNRPEVKEKKRQAYENKSEEEKTAIAEKLRQAQLRKSFRANTDVILDLKLLHEQFPDLGYRKLNAKLKELGHEYTDSQIQKYLISLKAGKYDFLFEEYFEEEIYPTAEYEEILEEYYTKINKEVTK